MAQVKANIKFDPKGTATVAIDLAGESEMEHELLAVFFTARSVSLVPFHDGDKLESRFVLEDPNAFAKAQRACENRIRVRDGRPTVEQEEAAKATRAKAVAEREAADAQAKKEGFAVADDKATKEARAAEFDDLAEAVANKLKPAPKA
ncbi:MAG: hypothetical protein WCC03_16130 [Candidatus Acidiferrales bacterium]